MLGYKESRHSEKKSQKVINIAKNKRNSDDFGLRSAVIHKKKPESYKYCEKKNEIPTISG